MILVSVYLRRGFVPASSETALPIRASKIALGSILLVPHGTLAKSTLLQPESSQDCSVWFSWSK